MENPPASPNMVRALGFGLASAEAVALVYGILADPVGLSWGLIVVGAVCGWVIGWAVVTGAFGGRFHLIVPRVRRLAVLVAVIAWIEATIVGYIGSQLFYQGAATPLTERLSVAGYFEYLNGAVIGPSVFGLAAVGFVAWRSAR